ncbi:DUF2235 domain-containing protein [Thiocystis violacea]|uniref:DUF2235 domain-containing protein n=1 Tax=Thiocystis violacea TaxID=13725 RepID=UPI001902C904|nr:DUF2235 domain-containing protein [Thiocystis violacea]MBK1718432.1 hypothetical protein [Thiocystis violacea]
MRHLVVCADGTWNTPEQETEGVPTPTNVVRLFNALASQSVDGSAQLGYYHPGIGSDGSRLGRFLGGTLGVGLGKNIMSAYRWLADQYQPGDRVFLFGFSRGAYTVRSLAGMVALCGLLKTRDLAEPAAWEQVERIYDRGYRHREPISRWDQGMAFHSDAHGEPPDVHFLGVWDTVGALGVPDYLEFFNLLDDSSKYTFHDTKLNRKILNARHAVALDENRASFAPTLWSDISDRPHVKQLWFPGNHGDVGGGHPETGLSDGALKWMMDEAQDQGLAFEPLMAAQITPNPRDVLHNSLQGVWSRLRHEPRACPALVPMNVGTLVHASVLERQTHPPIAQAPYRPTRLLAPGELAECRIYAAQHWNHTGLYLEQGVRYRFRAQGEWLDSRLKCGPAGVLEGPFQIGRLAHLAGSMMGSFEGLFARITHNEQADFYGSRRVEGAPWFALIARIANGEHPLADGTPAQHESIEFDYAALVGDGWEYQPRGSGYLYGFANDAWHFYGNNRGSLGLSLQRVSDAP